MTKKTMILALLAMLVQSSVFPAMAQTNNLPRSEQRRPVPKEYYRRFTAIDTVTSRNVYWLDSTTGHLWQLDRSLTEWEDCGTAKGMTPGPNGTYMLWADRQDGVYVLNTETGKGWWYDGNRWEKIDPADSAQKDNDSIY